MICSLQTAARFFYWTYTSDSDKPYFANPMLTEAFTAADPEAVWAVIDGAFHFSAGNFFLMQRLFCKTPSESHEWSNHYPEGVREISAAIKLYISAPPERCENQYKLFEFADDRQNFKNGLLGPVTDFSDAAAMHSAMKSGGTYLGARVIEVFFWHIHM